MTKSLRFVLVEQGIATHLCPCASAVTPLRLISLRTSMFSREPDGAAGPSTSQAFADFPSVPDFEQGGFRHSVDLLEGFEEFMDLTPNAPTSSYAAHGVGLAHAASAMTANSGTPANTAPNAEAPAATTATDNDRRTFRNRLSQRRFRERQRVGYCCCWFVTA